MLCVLNSSMETYRTEHEITGGATKMRVLLLEGSSLQSKFYRITRTNHNNKHNKLINKSGPQQQFASTNIKGQDCFYPELEFFGSSRIAPRSAAQTQEDRTPYDVHR